MKHLWTEFIAAPPTQKVLAVASQHTQGERLIFILSLFVVTAYSLSLSVANQFILPVVLIGALFIPRLSIDSRVWGFLTGVLFYSCAVNWSTADNHEWLFMLWGGTITLALVFVFERNRSEMLRINAKWMLILVMLLAVAQKALEPSYVDGSFFAYKLLIEYRFWSLSEWAGLTTAQLQENLVTLNSLLVSPTLEAAYLHTNATIVWLGHFITWWVWGIELVIGILLLLSSRLAQQLAHITNIYFIFVTYTFAPVLGFGSLLCVLGLLLTRANHPKLYKWYLGAFAYLTVLLVVL